MCGLCVRARESQRRSEGSLPIGEHIKLASLH
jgi:hypothetical protein